MRVQEAPCRCASRGSEELWYPVSCVCPRLFYSAEEPCQGGKSERPDCTWPPLLLLPGQEEALCWAEASAEDSWGRVSLCPKSGQPWAVAGAGPGELHVREGVGW